MNDALERAAKALWETWPERSFSAWENRRDVMREETRKEARNALLAFLDPNDAAMREWIMPYIEGDSAGDASEGARAVIAALRNYLSTAPTGEKT